MRLTEVHVVDAAPARQGMQQLHAHEQWSQWPRRVSKPSLPSLGTFGCDSRALTLALSKEQFRYVRCLLH